jgi:hypothetical protein
MEKEEQGAPSPEAIADVLERIAAGRAGATRFTVGMFGQRALVALRRVLPESGTDLILRKYYQL